MKLRIRTHLGIFAYDPNTDHITVLAGHGDKKGEVQLINKDNWVSLGTLKPDKIDDFFEYMSGAISSNWASTAPLQFFQPRVDP